MAAKITGRVEVLVNGELVLNKDGAIARGIGISGRSPFEREGIYGDGGLHGFKETPIPAECEVKITDRSDKKLSDFANINGDGTIIFRAAGGGKVYILDNATCLNNFELTAGEGEVTLRFVGPFWTESLS